MTDDNFIKCCLWACKVTLKRFSFVSNDANLNRNHRRSKMHIKKSRYAVVVLFNHMCSCLIQNAKRNIKIMEGYMNRSMRPWHKATRKREGDCATRTHVTLLWHAS